MAFNPVTVNSIKKTLSRICREEHKTVTAEQNDLIAKASGGDIRHAILSLQYFCLKPNPMLSLSLSDGTPTYSEERSKMYDGNSLPFGRDETLSLFHALGKFLHNKRAPQNSVVSGISRVTLFLKDIQSSRVSIFVLLCYHHPHFLGWCNKNKTEASYLKFFSICSSF